jgi:hypothetical protein
MLSWPENEGTLQLPRQGRRQGWQHWKDTLWAAWLCVLIVWGCLGRLGEDFGGG